MRPNRPGGFGGTRIGYLTTVVADLCWDTSTSSQVSNCDGLMLEIYLDHKFKWPQDGLNWSCMQEIHSSNPPVVTGISDPNKSWAPHHRSLNFGSKLKYLIISFQNLKRGLLYFLVLFAQMLILYLRFL